jgi:hypothetical protein
VWEVEQNPRDPSTAAIRREQRRGRGEGEDPGELEFRRTGAERRGCGGQRMRREGCWGG